MTLTNKQKDIIKTLNLGYERGHLLDLDELLEVLPYKTTKQSIQFSIRALIKKGLVEKGHTRQRSDNRYHRRTLGLTTLGRAKAKLLVM
ncbi:hypothetical protein ABGD54_RS21245 [Escherichia coli]|uniref:RGD cell attachment site containing protein n=1 Tax=Escherichia coli TaxID=562 RepID=A0A5N3CXU2_ECOLX|nr:hypothetical protein [Escherichia coli]EJF7891012.1 hypothetical protein [Shigella sonnei]EKK2982311.1 hypothetical protein [Escherichia coli O153]EKK3463448.1 hypothetical protein [Escherichia coli O145]EKY2436557.1 hypothetical protein [Escherichia coli O104]EEQ4233071.1 hypothetical protein [Escherichia coli]